MRQGRFLKLTCDMDINERQRHATLAFLKIESTCQAPPPPPQLPYHKKERMTSPMKFSPFYTTRAAEFSFHSHDVFNNYTSHDSVCVRTELALYLVPVGVEALTRGSHVACQFKEIVMSPVINF